MASTRLILESLMGHWKDEHAVRFHMAKTEPTGSTPLQALARSDQDWAQWQVYRGKDKERFTAPHVITFAQVSGDLFVFGGHYEIVDRSGEDYDVRLRDGLRDLIGRLVVRFPAPNKRRTVFTPGYFFGHADVAQIHPVRYRGEHFPGFEKVNHGYRDLELVYRNDLPDWRFALSNARGVYLIVDTSTGQQYVGSAEGSSGFWGRWGDYVETLHADNTRLREVVATRSPAHVMEHFRYSVLQVVGSAVTRDEVLALEALWKRKLGSRAVGLNAN